MIPATIAAYYYFIDCGDGSQYVRFFPDFEQLSKYIIESNDLDPDEWGEDFNIEDIKSWCSEDPYERGKVSIVLIPINAQYFTLAKPFSVTSD